MPPTRDSTTNVWPADLTRRPSRPPPLGSVTRCSVSRYSVHSSRSPVRVRSQAPAARPVVARPLFIGRPMSMHQPQASHRAQIPIIFSTHTSSYGRVEMMPHLAPWHTRLITDSWRHSIYWGQSCAVPNTTPPLSSSSLTTPPTSLLAHSTCIDLLSRSPLQWLRSIRTTVPGARHV